MTRAERIALGVLCMIFIISFTGLLRLFYVNNTDKVAIKGGTYIEASVGDISPLNPWFTITNDVNHDIVSLVFAGLMKYNALTGKIEEDLATMKVSDDNKIYTLTLKDKLFWHDTTTVRPHPVTADDVLFTFKTIQDPEFPNPILHQNFRGITIEKIDSRTVRFKLDKPYSFFPSNLTLGLLPAASFDRIPVSKLDQTIDFGLKPVGAGPYEFVSLMQSDTSTEVTLRRFTRPGLKEYKIDRIVFRVFNNYSLLLSDIMNVNGVRLVARNDKGKPILPQRFKPLSYTLPQYVGLFFNLDHDVFSDKTLRLGLQLATNKQEIVDTVHETNIVDTPLAEIDLSDWRYKFDPTAAQGALFASNWVVPEKMRLQTLLQQRETNAVGPLHGVQHIALLETGALLTITGSITEARGAASINGIRLLSGTTLPLARRTPTMSGSWLVELPTSPTQSGALRLGSNVIRLMRDNGKVLDTAYIERFADAKRFQLADSEQRLVDQFLRSKKAAVDIDRVSTDDLYLDVTGYLIRRKPTDLPHTRINSVNGKELKLTILTSKTPENYRKVAEIIRTQWQKIGVDVKIIVPETKKEFEDRMLSRDYDILLFGQSLLDNLDSYPYWHSSQIQEKTDDKKNLKLDAFNLSQYASFESDALLSRIRETSSGESRSKALNQLNEIMKKDIPAIFLYSPLYITAYDNEIQGIKLGNLALHSDRLTSVSDWFITTERHFKAGKSWLSFPYWLITLPFHN
ncbi:MAG: hypothetical protein KBD00_05005 [Candidatus Peribacteraceae bacterium]|nr:hypothetical protein [Candidatus Peribacteraceae bacterium]